MIDLISLDQGEIVIECEGGSSSDADDGQVDVNLYRSLFLEIGEAALLWYSYSLFLLIISLTSSQFLLLIVASSFFAYHFH